MTSLEKSVISINSNGNEQTYDSIGLAAKHMLTLEKYKNYNEVSVRSNISSICGGTSNRKICCGLEWKYKPIKTFDFIKDCVPIVSRIRFPVFFEPSCKRSLSFSNICSSKFLVFFYKHTTTIC